MLQYNSGYYFTPKLNLPVIKWQPHTHISLCVNKLSHLFFCFMYSQISSYVLYVLPTYSDCLRHWPHKVVMSHQKGGSFWHKAPFMLTVFCNQGFRPVMCWDLILVACQQECLMHLTNTVQVPTFAYIIKKIFLWICPLLCRTFI